MAPKVSTKRRSKTPSQEGMFADLHAYADSLNDRAGPDPADTATTPENDRIAALERTIEALQRQAEQAEATNMALTTRATAPQAPAAPAGIDFSGLPDPVEQPKEYGEALQGRIDQVIQNRLQYDRDMRAHQGAQNQTKDVLWEDFSEQFPEYALDEERMGFVTGKVLKRAQARGLDTERYMTGNTNRFFKDLVKEYNNVFGEPDGDAEDYEDDDDEPAPRQRSRRRSQRPEAEPRNRTAGIFGGLDGGAGRRPRGSDPLDDGPGDMIREIQEVQRKNGYY